jgi:protease PrsW
MSDSLLKGLIGLSPAALYLTALLLLDSYKLVSLRAVVMAMAVGGAVLIGCHFLNNALLEWTQLDVRTFSRYAAPVVEEAAKAVYIVALLRAHRLGFSIDAAIVGFAVGTGFGMLENVFYLHQIPGASYLTWVLRGWGTAIMHGSTTAFFAVLVHCPHERSGAIPWRRLVPALAPAVILHAAYNHFFVSPVWTVAGLVVSVPVIALIIFQRCERHLERWLQLGFDTDAELLAAINAGEVTATPVGTYLLALRERFPPTVVADMLCLLRLQAELAIQAKGMLLLRKGGFTVGQPDDAADRIAEIRYLERSVGPTGRMALRPFLRRSQRELWQRHLLQES